MRCNLAPQGLVVAPLGFLRPLGLATLALRSGLAATPRARARLWEAPEARFAASVPHHCLMILLGMSCVIAGMVSEEAGVAVSARQAADGRTRPDSYGLIGVGRIGTDES